MIQYEIRVTRDRRATNLQAILKNHAIKQRKLAEAADMENWQISEMCTGRCNDMYMSTAKRLCNALNELVKGSGTQYTLHDVFGD
jgi:DNA-binding Xre family transcriptional regulator